MKLYESFSRTLLHYLVACNIKCLILFQIKPDEDSLKIKKADSVFNLYSKPGLMLKYSCLKNLAVLSQKKNLLSEALEFYNQALEVEGTDVSMWFQSGCIAMKMFSIRAALEAFVKVIQMIHVCLQVGIIILFCE